MWKQILKCTHISKKWRRGSNAMLALCCAGFLAFSSAGCADSAALEESFKFVDAEVQAMFAQELRQQGVSFRQTSDQTVWYKYADRERVNEIIGNITKREYVDEFVGKSVVYKKPEHTRVFREKLTQHGIPYQIKTRSKLEHTMWSNKDHARVQKILKEVDQTIRDEQKTGAATH